MEYFLAKIMVFQPLTKSFLPSKHSISFCLSTLQETPNNILVVLVIVLLRAILLYNIMFASPAVSIGPLDSGLRPSRIF